MANKYTQLYLQQVFAVLICIKLDLESQIENLHYSFINISTTVLFPVVVSSKYSPLGRLDTLIDDVLEVGFIIFSKIKCPLMLKTLR